LYEHIVLMLKPLCTKFEVEWFRTQRDIAV
jgi:hypothetical protein